MHRDTGVFVPFPVAALPSGPNKQGNKGVIFVASFNKIHGLEGRQKLSSTSGAVCVLLCAGPSSRAVDFTVRVTVLS